VLSPPLEDLDVREGASPPTCRARRNRWSRSAIRRRRRRILVVVGTVFGLFFLWLAISLGSALTNPALGSSTGARAAEWFRGHGGASIVVWAENEWYSHHQPKVGGSLAAGAIRKPKETPSTTPAATVSHLPPPLSIAPIAHHRRHRGLSGVANRDSHLVFTEVALLQIGRCGHARPAAPRSVHLQARSIRRRDRNSDVYASGYRFGDVQRTRPPGSSASWPFA
jgi:hypothetical protein